MNPQIPTKPCVVCGVKTNETQSIIGIAHYKCFAKPEPPKSGNSWAVPVVRWIGARIQEKINAP